MLWAAIGYSIDGHKQIPVAAREAFHTLRRAHVQSRAMDLNGRSGEPQGSARLAMDVELGECGFQMVPAPTAFTASTVASREAQISGAADHVHVTFSTHPKIGQLPR